MDICGNEKPDFKQEFHPASALVLFPDKMGILGFIKMSYLRDKQGKSIPAATLGFQWRCQSGTPGIVSQSSNAFNNQDYQERRKRLIFCSLHFAFSL